MKIDIQEMLEYSVKAAIKAGKSILRVYNSPDISVKLKKDESPITLADKRSNRAIKSLLRKTKYPILSEEGFHTKYQKRKEWKCFWMIDPLDGTADFIKKNDEFSINIALIYENRPVLGVIYAPVSENLYIGTASIGSLKVTAPVTNANKLDVKKLLSKGTKLPLVEKNEKIVVVGSRSHLTEETKHYYEKLENKYGDISIVSKGSSLKLCLIAEGTADIYPRLGSTMEWDTAAGDAVIKYSGGTIRQHQTSKPLMYNKENLLNPWFIAERVK